MDRFRTTAGALALIFFTAGWIVTANNGLSWGRGAFSLPLAAAPFLFVTAGALFLLRDRSRVPSSGGAAALLAAALVAYLLSDYAAYKWFFWIGLERRNFLLVLAVALSFIFLFRRRPVPAATVLILLVTAQVYLTWHFLEATGGAPLQRDDHPSFFYRLQLLRETWPQIVSYDPRWNGGRITTELLQTGILTVAPLFLPVAKLLPHVPLEKIYTPFLAFLFHWILPSLFYIGLRLFGAGRSTALWGALLSLYPNRYFFINLLPWGVFPSLVSMALVVPAAGALYRIIVLNKPGWTAPLVLALSLTSASFWPASFFTFFPLAILLLVSIPRMQKRQFVLLASAVVLFFILLSPWLRSFLASGE